MPEDILDWAEVKPVSEGETISDWNEVKPIPTKREELLTEQAKVRRQGLATDIAAQSYEPLRLPHITREGLLEDTRFKIPSESSVGAVPFMPPPSAAESLAPVTGRGINPLAAVPQPEPTDTAKTAAALINVATDALSSLTSPENVAILAGTMGVGALGRVGQFLQKGATGAFGVEGAKTIIEGKKAFDAATTPEEKGNALGQIFVGASMTPGIAHAAMPIKKLPIKGKPPILPVEEKPITATTEVPNASSITPTTTVHGDVQPSAVEGTRQVPVEDGVRGIQSREGPPEGIQEVPASPQVAVPAQEPRSPAAVAPELKLMTRDDRRALTRLFAKQMGFVPEENPLARVNEPPRTVAKQSGYEIQERFVQADDNNPSKGTVPVYEVFYKGNRVGQYDTKEAAMTVAFKEGMEDIAFEEQRPKSAAVAPAPPAAAPAASAAPGRFPNTGVGSPAGVGGAIHGPKLSPEVMAKFKEQVGESFELLSAPDTTTTLKVKPTMLWVEVNRRLPGPVNEFETGVAYMHINSKGETVLDASKHGRPIDKQAADALMAFLQKSQPLKKAQFKPPQLEQRAAPAAPAAPVPEPKRAKKPAPLGSAAQLAEMNPDLARQIADAISPEKLPPAKLTPTEEAAAKAVGLKIVEPPTRQSIDVASTIVPEPKPAQVAADPTISLESPKRSSPAAAQAAAPPEGKGAVKEPWQMTLQQFAAAKTAPTEFDPRQITLKNSVNFALNQGKMPLSDLIDAPELFAQFPDLATTTIEVRPTTHKVGGWWDFDSKNIVVSPQHETPFRRIIAHEIQHAIDTIKGRKPSETNTKLVDDFLSKGVRDAEDAHETAVTQALREGKPVPESVLADYPDLQPKPAPPAAAQGQGGLEAQLRDADNFAGKASNIAEQAVRAWATHVEDVVNPIKAQIRKIQSEVFQMGADAKRTKPETPSRSKLTKKKFLAEYGVASMEEANELYKSKNAQWAELEKQLEAAEVKRKELEDAKERRGKEWSAAATRAGELRRQVYPKVREGDVGAAQPAAPESAAAPQAPRAAGGAVKPKRTIGEIRRDLEGGKAGEAGMVNADILRELIDHGKTLFRKGMEYAGWATEMLRSFGEKVRGYLKGVWDSVNPKAEEHPDLADVYRIFKPGPKDTKPSVTGRIAHAAEAFRTGFSSSFRPLNKLAEDIAKAYGYGKREVAGIFEQLKGSSGKAEADVYRFDQDVSKLVKGNEKDFNAYMFLRRSLDRLRQDEADIQKAIAGGDVEKLNRRKVSEYTIPQLESKLAVLEEKLSPEVKASFERAADAYQKHMDQALQLQVDSGRMSPEIYRNIKEGNQFYAPFKVMKYIEQTMAPTGSGRKVDTTADYVKAMEGIESPDFRLGDMLAAARQNITLSRVLAEKNRAMRQITDLAAMDIEGKFVRKLKPGEDADPALGYTTVFEEGVKQRYEVPQEVETALAAVPNAGGMLLARYAGNTFRAGATTYNLPFQVANIAADLPRQALVSKYGLRGVTDLIRYPLDYFESVLTSIGSQFGYNNKLALDFLDSGVAGTTIQQYLTPEALKFKPDVPGSRIMREGKKILDTLPQFANAIEQATKILGVKRAMRFEGVTSGKELAKHIPEAITELRRFSGSPDFGRTGKWTDQYKLNLLYMFLNARIQGAVADVGRLTGRDGASTATKTWIKMGAAVGIPSVLLYSLNQSDEYKDDYAKRPEWEKRNYWLIPKDTFITTKSGEKIRDYHRIPKREIAKWFGNGTELALDFARERDPQAFWNWAAGMAEELSPVNIQGKKAQERLESVGSSLNPLVKTPLEIATGRDMYRHHPIVPDSMRKASPEQQFTERTPDVFKVLAEKMPDIAPEFLRSPLILENATKNLTAGLITQFLRRGEPLEGRGTIANLPILQRFQGAPYVDTSKIDEQLATYEREAADVQLKRHRAAADILSANKGKTLPQIVEAQRAVLSADPKLLHRIIDLTIAEKNGIKPEERRIQSLPTQQRAEFISAELKGKTTEQKQALLRNYALKRIYTEAVAEEMAKLSR